MAAAPTLLVFTLGPDREARRKALLPREHGDWERALYRSCLERTLAAGRSLGMGIALCAPEPESLASGVRPLRQLDAGGFGARLSRALADAFAGSDGGPVVLVGTDVPGLGRREVDRALEILRRRPAGVVLGPSPDGGIYLLATARPLGDLLDGVAWCCSRTRESLERTLTRAGIPVTRLAPLGDLDRPRDLAAWLARGPAPGDAALVAVLQALLRDRCRPPVESRGPGASLGIWVTLRGRAPPVARPS